MKKLILIRHGETEYSLKGWCCGQKDIPLTKIGIKQAACAIGRLKNIKIDKVYTSDLQRVRHAASIIFEGRRVYIRKALREIDFGRFGGLTYPQIKKRYPREYKMLMSDILKAKIPGGESFTAFKRRVEGAFLRIFNNNRGQTVAIVGHINPIRIILLKVLGGDIKRFWEIKQTPGAINIITFNKSKPVEVLINNTDHLLKR